MSILDKKDQRPNFKISFQDWVQPIRGTRNSVFNNEEEQFGVENLWDNKLGRTHEEFRSGQCFQSGTTHNHEIEMELDREYSVSAISILNRGDYRS